MLHDVTKLSGGSGAGLGGLPLLSRSQKTFPAGGQPGGMAPPLTRTFGLGGLPLIHVVTKFPSGSSVGLGGPPLLSRGHQNFSRQAVVEGGWRPPWAWTYGLGGLPLVHGVTSLPMRW